jgi:alginate O-acetyltransferase complex protein AlgI
MFLPVTLLLHGLAKDKYRNYILLLGSMFFYAWGGLKYLLLVMAITLVNYICGLAMGEKEKHSSTARRLFLMIAIAVTFIALIYFKYFNFIAANLIRLLRTVNIIDLAVQFPSISLPVGISFFTFQIASYTIDVYKGLVAPLRNPLKLLLYVLLFPQLIAGPIIRYADVIEEINCRTIQLTNISIGIQRFIIGFCKKILLANKAGFIADTVINAPEYYSTPACWFGIICYSFQIYFDFAAYSDMAIGIGEMLGFHFKENFNYPYIANSVQEFWRRWHISLSSWFRDYLYIPLGGNREGAVRTYFNLFTVFLLTGFWHGASWNFIIWGIWHGLFLVSERIMRNKLHISIPVIIERIYTLFVILIGWVFFRLDGFHNALNYIKIMFTANTKNMTRHIMLLDREVILFFIMAFFFSTPLFPKAKAAFKNYFKQDTSLFTIQLCRGVYLALLLCLFFISILYMGSSGFNPFIYFRF